MNGMDRQMRELLDAAVGEPPHQVSVEAVRRRVIRRRVMEYVATGAAVAVTAAAVLAGIGALGRGPGRSAAASTAVPTVYVCNVKGTVIPIRIATNTAGKPIRVGFLAVTAIAITPDEKTAYVVEGSGSSGTVPPIATVIPIATATNTAGKPIKVGRFFAGPIAITPDGKTAYVVESSGSSGAVIPIATATNTVGKPIKVGRLAGPIAITPDGKTAYVASWSLGTVIPIATATNTAGKPIKVGSSSVVGDTDTLPCMAITP